MALQAGARMALVLLTLGIIMCGMGSNPFQKDCYSEKDCKGMKYDIREAVCCERCLHPGAGLACCGNQSYNPAEAACCREEDGHILKANVTPGLSQCISSCCGLTAFNPLNEMCCKSTVVAKPAAHAKCCGGVAFDKDTHLCCDPIGEQLLLPRLSDDHLCCGKEQYDTKTECCCDGDYRLEVKPKGSNCCEKESAPCGQNKTYNTLNELCCNLTVVAKPTPQTKCCGKETFNADTQMCCGLHGQRVRLERVTDHHLCCGQKHYDSRTHCCPWVVNASQIEPIGSKLCVDSESGVEPQNHRPQSTSTHIGHQMECLKSSWCCTSGPADVFPTVCSQHANVCCRSGWRPPNDQVCGGTRAILAQGKQLCCDPILHKDREDGNKCQDSGVPHHSAAGTVCCSRFHGSPGEHCCGTELYQPHDQICCGGHRYPKIGGMRCCGVKAYNIKNGQMKCCAGRLHSLPDKSAHKAQCCGSMLQKSSDVCCTSENEEVLYSPKPGFRCCGHLYFNTSLWTCCEERLSPVHKPHQHHSELIEEYRLVSLNNLGEDDLCGEIHAGIVDSVSLHSIVFSSVMQFHGRNGTVKHLPSTYILKKPDHCNFPRLIPGKTYFFTPVIVSIDFNHDSLLRSLHFIFSKCFHP